MSFTKLNKPLFALVDCNNFYISCERVFNPRLWNKPVVALSNNDGCVIARSNEAKALGIPMGAPAYQYAQVFRTHKVIACSSNYALYGDMSRRVMQTLTCFACDIEIYSIDEAFLLIPDCCPPDKFAKQIQQTVQQWIGIPVSIGIGSTKTLAKAANRYAKKSLTEGFFYLDKAETKKEILSQMPVEDVWGIGRQHGERLRRHGMATAWDLANANDDWIKKHLSIVGLRTVWELRGISCLSLQEVPSAKKSIVCSRSFGMEVTEKKDLEEALAAYTACAAEKLRHQGSVASFIEVFLNTSRFKADLVYANAAQIVLPQPTDYTPYLIQYAKYALEKIFRKGLSYKKVGIMLGGLVSHQSFQQDLFVNPTLLDKQAKAMRLLDQMNTKYGQGTLKFAAEGIVQNWKTKRERCSPHYTTCWEDLLRIRI